MIEVYTDGASQGNPGPSGAGIYIKATNETFSRSLPLPEMSNHEAEFQAVRYALEICRIQFPKEILSFRSDSQIVVDTIQNNFTKNKTFEPILQDIMTHMEIFPYVFFKWIPEKQNHHADKLARKAIREI